MSTQAACPKCGRDDRLYSAETIIAEYHVSITDDAAGNRELDYTGEDTRTFDETSEFGDEIHCRACDWMGTIDQLATEAVAR